MSHDCFCCKIATGEISVPLVVENDKAVAFREINPQVPHHLLSFLAGNSVRSTRPLTRLSSAACLNWQRPSRAKRELPNLDTERS